MDKIILFDLENTLIGDWNDDRRLMCARFPCLKEWTENEKPFVAGLMSFAVWDEKDLNDFNHRLGIRDDIEITHDFKFNDDWIFLRNSLLEPFRKILKMPFLTMEDLFSFFDKGDIVKKLWLDKWIKEFPTTEFVFLDDTIEDMVIHKDEAVLRFVNPWTIIHAN